MVIKEILKDGKVKLIGKLIDTRTNVIYHEVVCNKRDVKYFKEVNE